MIMVISLGQILKSSEHPAKKNRNGNRATMCKHQTKCLFMEMFFLCVCVCAASSKSEIYFMALIDVLTKYGMKKRTAQAAKTVKHGAGAEISTVRPDQYARRFLDFISKCIE